MTRIYPGILVGNRFIGRRQSDFFVMLCVFHMCCVFQSRLSHWIEWKCVRCQVKLHQRGGNYVWLGLPPGAANRPAWVLRGEAHRLVCSHRETALSEAGDCVSKPSSRLFRGTTVEMVCVTLSRQTLPRGPFSLGRIRVTFYGDKSALTLRRSTVILEMSLRLVRCRHSNVCSHIGYQGSLTSWNCRTAIV